MDVTQLGNWTLTYFSVTGSSVDGDLSAVAVGGTTHVGDEQIADAEAYGAPGIVFRPRAPETIKGKKVGAEAQAARTPDGLVPLSWRDLRWNNAYPAPKEGSVAFVGYGGGFLALEDTSAAHKPTRATLYVPYAYSGDTPTKAMVISMDPEAETLMVIHGEGYAITFDKDNGITARADETTWWNMKPGQFTAVANKIILQGNVALGASPSTAIPLATPTATPSASVFVSSPT